MTRMNRHPTLHLSKDLRLPVEAVTQTFAILAKRGVGKTDTAAVIVEELLNAGLQGSWWIRSACGGGCGPRPTASTRVFPSSSWAASTAICPLRWGPANSSPTWSWQRASPCRPYAEARTLCRAYAIMRADREALSAGEVAHTVAPYQHIRAHRPDTPWLGVSMMTASLKLALSISGFAGRLTGSRGRPQP
jgi:Helicase HerA, central domain